MRKQVSPAVVAIVVGLAVVLIAVVFMRAVSPPGPGPMEKGNPGPFSPGGPANGKGGGPGGGGAAKPGPANGSISAPGTATSH